MSEENRKIAEDILAWAWDRDQSVLEADHVAHVQKFLDEAERRGLKQGREEHKAGCMIAYQRGAEKMRERAARVCVEGAVSYDPDVTKDISMFGETAARIIRALPLGVSDSELSLEGISEADIRKAVSQAKPVEDVMLPVVFPNALGITKEEFEGPKDGME